jgi:hypothetical protein
MIKHEIISSGMKENDKSELKACLLFCTILIWFVVASNSYLVSKITNVLVFNKVRYFFPLP